MSTASECRPSHPHAADPRARGSAIVIGGGIGGLATAVSLRRIGWTATVLERRDTVTEIGAGLSQRWPDWSARALAALWDWTPPPLPDRRPACGAAPDA